MIFLYSVPLNYNIRASLDSEWLSPTKLEERESVQVLNAQILSLYSNLNPPSTSLPPIAAPTIDISPYAPATTHAPTPDPSTGMVIPPTPDPFPYPLGTSLCRSTCANRGTYKNTRYQDEVFYFSILDPSLSYQYDITAYRASIGTDFQTGLINGTNPRAYADS